MYVTTFAGPVAAQASTTGSIDVNLSNIGRTINAGTGTAAGVTEGLEDYSGLIGIGIALSLAIGFLLGVVIAALAIIVYLLRYTKNLKKYSKSSGM